MTSKIAHKIAIAFGILVFVLSGCASPDAGSAVETSQAPLAPLPPATAPPTTTTTTTTVGVPQPPDVAEGTVCDLYEDGFDELGEVDNEAIVEASGIAASRRHDGIFWVVNDSGNDDVVYAITRDGTTAATIEVDGVLGFDWEAIAVGPGPEESTSYIYVGDIGDNLRLRSTISLLRFPEPELADAVVTDLDTIRLSFPDEARDSEAMWVDPITGDAFVVTKRQANGKAVVFRARAERLEPGEPAPLEEVADFRFGEGIFVTAADVTADGSVVAFRGYNEVWMWIRTDLSYEATFTVDPCMGPSPDEVQGEAIAFLADGIDYVTISEGSNKALNQVSAR